MSQIELAPEINDDFDRILDHLAQHDVESRADRIGDIIQAINVLEYNPLISRPVRAGMNEIVISRDAHGYVALYRYVAVIDTVFVLAIRSQREAGYARKAF
jgi:toxin ParE1/3/4